MPRVTPSDRLPKLLDAAAGAFIEHGFGRTQMDDVAERLGVSKGTIYRAVDSKEALFAAVIAWADDPDGAPATGEGVTTNPAELASSITTELTAAIADLELTAIVTKRRRLRSGAAVGEELERLTIGIYRVMQSRRIAVMVLDRCASEIPELAAVWFGEGRYALVDLWAEYLQLRTRAVSPEVDQAVLARTIVEIITTWAVKMPWDSAPRPYADDTAAACAVMVRNLVSGSAR